MQISKKQEEVSIISVHRNIRFCHRRGQKAYFILTREEYNFHVFIGSV